MDFGSGYAYAQHSDDESYQEKELQYSDCEDESSDTEEEESPIPSKVDNRIFFEKVNDRRAKRCEKLTPM
jgi:hypothetical protein